MSAVRVLVSQACLLFRVVQALLYNAPFSFEVITKELKPYIYMHTQVFCSSRTSLKSILTSSHHPQLHCNYSFTFFIKKILAEMNQCLIIEVIFLKQLHVFSREVDQVRVKVHTTSYSLH